MRFTLIIENAAGDRINMTATANKYMISKIRRIVSPCWDDFHIFLCGHERQLSE